MLGSYCVKEDEKRTHLVEKLTKAFARVEILHVTRKDAVKSAEVAGRLLARGISVGNDAIVAGIALAHGLHVTTRNRKHFEPIQEMFALTTTFY
ncbi:MAG: type II toxin-antitoxin system VapC family toxin [Candidatus Lokiarchaeota archaeon]|nr:type II toxin-antitoxin system VapC family toxin [Candidatus Lokiarchaeota archaeon]